MDIHVELWLPSSFHLSSLSSSHGPFCWPGISAFPGQSHHIFLGCQPYPTSHKTNKSTMFRMLRCQQIVCQYKATYAQGFTLVDCKVASKANANISDFLYSHKIPRKRVVKSKKRILEDGPSLSPKLAPLKPHSFIRSYIKTGFLHAVLGKSLHQLKRVNTRLVVDFLKHSTDACNYSNQCYLKPSTIALGHGNCLFLSHYC